MRLKAGALLPWGRGCFAKPSYIGDRFFLGGTGDLRGFWVKGAGPTGRCRGVDDEGPAGVRPSVVGEERKRDALGGDLMFSALASVRGEDRGGERERGRGGRGRGVCEEAPSPSSVRFLRAIC